MMIFEEIKVKFKYIYNEAESIADVLSAVNTIENLINKLETRFNKYENALKEYADPNNWTYENSFEGDSFYTAKYALQTDEELYQQKINELKTILKDFDKSVIFDVISELNAEKESK